MLNEKHRDLLISRGVIVNDERYDLRSFLKQSDKWWVVLFQAIRRRLRSKDAVSTEELAQVQKHFPSLVVSAVTQHFQHMARLKGETEPDIEAYTCIRVLLGQDGVEHEFRESVLSALAAQWPQLANRFYVRSIDGEQKDFGFFFVAIGVDSLASQANELLEPVRVDLKSVGKEYSAEFTRYGANQARQAEAHDLLRVIWASESERFSVESTDLHRDVLPDQAQHWMERRVECRVSLHRTETGWVVGYNEHSVFVPLGIERVELPGSSFVFELVDRRSGDVG